MGKRLSEANARYDRGGSPGGRRSAVILVLLACLVVASCAQRDGSAEKDRPGGFYGGISGGNGM
jgi:hypothetical protein